MRTQTLLAFLPFATAQRNTTIIFHKMHQILIAMSVRCDALPAIFLLHVRLVLDILLEMELGSCRLVNVLLSTTLISYTKINPL